MRKIRALRYFGLCLAWSMVIAWLLPEIDLPFELWFGLCLLGSLLFAIPDKYILNNHRASGWLLIFIAIGGFVMAGRYFEHFLSIATMVMFPLVITGAALAELQDRG